MQEIKQDRGKDIQTKSTFLTASQWDSLMAKGPAAGEEVVDKDRGGRAARLSFPHRKTSFHDGSVNLGQLEVEVGGCENGLQE